MLQLDPPGQCHPDVHPKYLLSTQKYARKNQKSKKRPKVAKKGDFARQISPCRKCFLRLFSCPSSRPVRDSCFTPPNFDQGLKPRIISDSCQAIKNDYLQSKKSKNGHFCTLKFGLKKKLQFFLPHLLGPLELVVLHLRTLIGD